MMTVTFLVLQECTCTLCEVCILSIPVQPVVVVSKLGGGRAGCFCVLSLAYELMTFEEEPNIPEDWKKDNNIIDQVSIIRAVDPGGRW